MVHTLSKIAGSLLAAVLLAAPALARDKLIIEPFSKKYDVDVQVITAYSADALAQLRAQKAAPQFDVIHFSGGQEVVAARDGLISPLKPADLTSSKDLYPFATEGLARGE